MDEVVSRTRTSVTHKPARNQFGVRAKRGPGPNVTPSLSFLFRAGVLLLSPAKRPYFVALNPFTFEVRKNLILVFRTRPTNVHQQLRHGILCRTRHSHGGSNAVALDQTGNDFHSIRIY